MPTIRELRQQKGWTQQELAERATVSMGTVVRVERGDLVHKNTVKRLCEVLGVRVENVSGVNIRRKYARE